MDREREKIEHQLELATRIAETIKDETTVQRLRSLAEELRHRLWQLMRRPRIRARAYELWEKPVSPSAAISSFGLKQRDRSPSGRIANSATLTVPAAAPLERNELTLNSAGRCWRIGFVPVPSASDATCCRFGSLPLSPDDHESPRGLV
jgi:hypothetical protein